MKALRCYQRRHRDGRERYDLCHRIFRAGLVAPVYSVFAELTLRFLIDLDTILVLLQGAISVSINTWHGSCCKSVLGLSHLLL